ncbi:MAG: von Willebrand factor type A domain protein [Lentisphaerae bacterium ADurb.Bin082]|nr:MAG: von Willebrand factor type A domain protein [Lentisphaerae bacterium ADurb.Bin082]
MSQMIFNPAAFVAPKAKPMPVILVLDNSGSMSGEKITSLNEAVRVMLETFKKAECDDAAFNLAIVTFGTGIHLLQPMTGVSQIHWQDIPISSIEACKRLTGTWDDAAARGTPLGATLRILKAMIEDKTVIPSRVYRPAIILVSDGHPTDKWSDSLAEFTQEGRSSKCDRWAMAIGRDADAGTLGKFIAGIKNEDGTPRKLLYANDAKTLKDNFSFITMSVTNSVATASQSKVLTVRPITVVPTCVNEGHDAPKLAQKPMTQQKAEEDDDGFW